MNIPAIGRQLIGRLDDDVRLVIERLGLGGRRDGRAAARGRGRGGAHGAGEEPVSIGDTVDHIGRDGPGEGGLRIFHGHGQPEGLIQQILGDAQLRLAGIDKAGHHAAVDHRRRDFAARRNTFGIQGRQRPGLARQDMPAGVVPVHGAVHVPDPRIEGVLLVRIGGLGGALEIQFAVPGQQCGRVRLALNQGRNTARAVAESQLAHMAGLDRVERYGVPRRGCVAGHIMVAGYPRGVQVTAERDREAFIVQSVGLRLIGGDRSRDLIGDGLDRRCVPGVGGLKLTLHARGPGLDLLDRGLGLSLGGLLSIETRLHGGETSLEVTNLIAQNADLGGVLVLRPGAAERRRKAKNRDRGRCGGEQKPSPAGRCALRRS